MNAMDEKFLRRSFVVAARARTSGNHPYGAILVGPDNDVLLEAGNSVILSKDVTAHAELNLIRMASQKYPPDYLQRCTLYASTEPCPMCAGAIYWSSIGRVVFGLSQGRLYRLPGFEEARPIFVLPCADVLARGGRKTEVVGPLLEDEAVRVHEGFWVMQKKLR